MKHFTGLLLLLLLTSACVAQTDTIPAEILPLKKGKFYIAWGYNKDWYSKTDVRVHDDVKNTMDFTLYDMTARDHPQWQDIFKVQPSIPQYGYRIGYWMPNGKFGVELNFDHAKYIVNDYQTAHLRGTINGEYFDQDTLVSYSFLHLEHTDGANFLMFNLMYRRSVFTSPHVSSAWIVKAGGGIVVPRTDVTLFGQRWNHCFHVAGQVAGIETGLRTEFFRYFFVETTFKTAYANFSKVLTINDVLISHRFGAAMVEVHVGFQVPMGKGR